MAGQEPSSRSAPFRQVGKPPAPQHSELIALAYDAALDPALWPRFLGGVNRHLNANAACMFLHDFGDSSARYDRPDISIGALHGFDPRAWQDYVDHYCHHNVWAQNEDGLKPGAAVTSSMLYPDSRLMHTEYGNDWLRPQDLFYALGGITDRQGSVALKLSFVRPKRFGPYDGRALALWQSVIPHVQRAADLHRRLVQAEVRARDAEGTLAPLPTGVVPLRGDGGMLHANPAARQMLAARKGLFIGVGGQVEALAPASRQALAAELHATLDPLSLPPGAAFRPRVLQVRGPAGRLQLALNTLPRHSDLTPVTAAAAMFVTDPDASPPDLSAGLMALWSLTAAEAALTSALVAGQSVKEYAVTAGIGLATARTHLHHASSKVGAKRQADLVRVVLASQSVLLPREAHSGRSPDGAEG